MKVFFHFSNVSKVEKRYYVGMELGFSDLDSIIKHKKNVRILHKYYY